MYGAQTWNFNDKNVKLYHTMWNRCARRLLDLPWRTHSRFLPTLTGLKNSQEKAMSMFMTCVRTMSKCDNEICNFIVQRGIHNADSIIGSNLRQISRVTKLEVSKLLQQTYLPRMYTLTIDERCAIKCVTELRTNEIDGYTEEERKTFMNFLLIS